MQPSVGSPLFTAKPEGSVNCLDPLRPENLALSRQRYLSLKETYPDADFYCFWQSEGQGVRGAAVGQEEGAAAMINLDSNWFLLLVPAALVVALVLMLRYTGNEKE